LALGFYFGDLIRSQLDINPLHMAAEMDGPILVGILLKFYPQIDVNQLTTSGSTAVGLAVGKKCVKSLKALLNDPRTDLNLNKSVSPLIRSIEICPIEAVELLLSHPSINVNHQITRNSKILSPLGRAVTQRKWPVLDLLLQHPNANYDPDNDRVVLQHLKEAEKCLIRYGDQYYDLLMLIRRLILPTISE
jgi:ankyrin repeat protein